MAAENVLEKTNRINMLFDFYQQLLTEKQQMFLKLYFHDNYSLGEIAEEFSISRQAVYEHIKRAEHMLDEYELKLALLSKHEQRHHYLQQMHELLERNNDSENNILIKELLQKLQAID